VRVSFFINNFGLRFTFTTLFLHFGIFENAALFRIQTSINAFYYNAYFAIVLDILDYLGQQILLVFQFVAVRSVAELLLENCFRGPRKVIKYIADTHLFRWRVFIVLYLYFLNFFITRRGRNTNITWLKLKTPII